MANVERLGPETYVNSKGDVVGPDDFLAQEGIDPDKVPFNSFIVAGISRTSRRSGRVDEYGISSNPSDYDPSTGSDIGVSVDLGERALLLMGAVEYFNKRGRALGMQKAASSEYETDPVKRYGRKNAKDIADNLSFSASRSRVLLDDAARGLAKSSELIGIGFTDTDLDITGATADIMKKGLEYRFEDSGAPRRKKAVDSARKAAGLDKIER